MNEKIKNILKPTMFIFGLACSIIISTSCSNKNLNETTNKEIKLEDLFSEKSLKEIDDFIFNSSSTLSQMSKEEFQKKVQQTLEINQESDYYKALTLEGDIDKYNQEIKKEISEAMILEFEESIQQNFSWEKHGSIFKAHFWRAVGAKGITFGLNTLIIVDYSLPLIAAVGSFIVGDYASLVDALTGFDGQLSPTTKWLIESGVNQVRKFKTDSKCKWNFKVWGYEIKSTK